MANIKDKYDVIVIGAGMGGLTCGAFLAKEGLSVLVAEQHSEPGGCCTSFRRKGFTFDTGIEDVAGAERGGMLYNVLEELGLEDEIKFIELTPRTRIVGSDYNIPSTPPEGLAKELKRMFPGEGMSIDAFVQDCKAVISEMMALAETAPDLLGFGGMMGLMVKFLFKSPKLRRYGGKSYRQALAESFKEPKLRAILGSLLAGVTEWAATTPMMALGMSAFQYPRGGTQALAATLAKGVTKHGGDLALKTLVKKIVVEDGKTTGVELADGTMVRSRYVVSNADGRQTFLKLISEQHLSPKLAKELKETRLTDPVFLVSLGVDIDLKAMGFDGTTIIYNRSDNIDDICGGDAEKCSLVIMMHSLLDPSQAPEGMATVQIMTLFPYDYMSYWKREKDGTRGKEYTELKEALADKLIVSAEKVIPQLSKHIVCKDIATPLTYERYTLNCEGASHGWFPAPGAKMRSQKTPFKNLYQAGHWTFPGPGISAVALSGRNAAKLVLGKFKRS
jgi:all-trans-retinol 13,14-reductase